MKSFSFEDLMNIFLKSQQNKDYQAIFNINKEFERRVNKRKLMKKKPMKTSVSGFEQTQEWLAKNSDLSISASNILKENETTLKSKEYSFETLSKKLTSQPEINKTLFIKIDELDLLSVRSLNCLKNENIIYVGDLIQLNENYLLKSNNFGRKSLEELKNILSDMSLPVSGNKTKLIKRIKEENVGHLL